MKNNALYRNIFVLTLTILYSAHIMAQTGTREFKIVNDLDAVKQKTYFSFDKGQRVENVDTTGKGWDLVFARTVILVNSGTSGQGSTTAQLLKDTSFDKIQKAPASGYLEDSQKTKAIAWGSNNGWYTYDMTNHSITPIPGRIIVVHTSFGKYVKVEILNYYKNGDGDSGYYTFKYSFIESEN